MPAAIPNEIRNRVIKQWLSGDSRDRIADDNNIGAGTVSNIVNEWKGGIEDSNYDSVRELAQYSKKEGFSLSNIASSTRLINYIQKLGANQDHIESFIANLANSSEPEKMIDVANQVAQLSRFESIPLEDLEDHVKQKEEEMQTLEDEINQRRAILESTDVEIQTINEYKQLERGLKKYGLSMEDPHILLSILETMKQIGYNPREIVSEISRMKSLRQTERRLKNNCKIFESRMARCQEVLPMSEQIVRLGIGIPELLALHTAVLKKADMENLPMGTAAYRVMEDIEDYNKLGRMKKQLSDVGMQIFTMNQISARQNKAVIALARLQTFGVAEDDILDVSEFLNSARLENASRIRH